MHEYIHTSLPSVRLYLKDQSNNVSSSSQVEMSSKTLLQDLKELVTKAEINIFLVMMLLMGSSWGFIESYLFVFLKELNAPNYLLGNETLFYGHLFKK